MAHYADIREGSRVRVAGDWQTNNGRVGTVMRIWTAGRSNSQWCTVRFEDALYDSTHMVRELEPI